MKIETGGSKEFEYTDEDYEKIRSEDTEYTKAFKNDLTRLKLAKKGKKENLEIFIWSSISLILLIFFIVNLLIEIISIGINIVILLISLICFYKSFKLYNFYKNAKTFNSYEEYKSYSKK